MADDTTIESVEEIDELVAAAEDDGDWAEAVGELEALAEATTDSDLAVYALRRVGQICVEQLDDEERAVEAYNGVLELEPADGVALEALETLFQESEDWEALIEVLERKLDVADEDDERIEILRQCALIHEDVYMNDEEAARYHQRILAMDPEDEDAQAAMDRLED